MREKLKDRYIVLSIFLILFGLAIILRLFDLQVVKGQMYKEESQKKIKRETKIVAPRGNIYDRNGIPIAVNKLGYTVQMVQTKPTEAELNEMLLKLVEIFEKNNDKYFNSLSNYISINPFKYGSYINGSEQSIENWIKRDVILKDKDLELINSPEDTFKYLRNNRFNIDEKYTDEEAYKIILMRYERLVRGIDRLKPITIAEGVSKETIAEIEERSDEFPGVTTESVPFREYIDGQLIAHVLGYVRTIKPEQYKEWKLDGYGLNDIVGQAGIELEMEKELRGVNGNKTIEVDIDGRVTGQLEENPAVPGNDIYLTIDSNIQKVAMESLERNIKEIREKDAKGNFGDANAGAVVAINVKNGDVLALASYPSYDPTIFLTNNDKEINKLYDASISNEDRPAVNRAIQGTYAPGSTFKPITAIAGIEEGIITADDIIYDSGKSHLGGMDFWCLEYRMGLGAHGSLNLERALATSCNIYFHELGVRTGIDNIAKWAKYFGLGEKTGISLPFESKGILSSREYKNEIVKDSWWIADTAQSAIGQLYNSFTPLQLANYVSTLANGGTKFTPNLVKKVVDYKGSIKEEIIPEYTKIPIKPQTIEDVKKGMIAVTNSVDGTAVQIFKNFPFEVAGKTGTAETGNEANHSSNALFVCYAPADDPQIAVAVVVERGVWGSNTAPIAKDVLAQYFHLNNEENFNDKIDSNEIVLIP